MKATENYRVIVLNGKDDDYAIVSAWDITDGNLIDTSTGTGESLRHSDVGDYSFGACEFDSNLLAAIKEHFNLDNDLEGLSFDDSGDELEIMIDSSSYEQDEYLENFVDGNRGDILKFVKEWAAENESLVKATYIDYWDGSNNNSIILSTDLDDGRESDYELMDEDDEDAIRVIEEYLGGEKENEEDGVGTHEWDTKNYHFFESTWERDSWFVALVDKITD